MPRRSCTAWESRGIKPLPPGQLKFNLAAGPGFAHNGGLETGQTPPPTVNEVTGWRWLLLWLLSVLLRVWVRTLRFEAEAETVARLSKSDVPIAFVLWHNRLFLSPEIFRRYRTRRPLYGLVSASKDGAWLAAFYRMIGLLPVRGSSSNFGREAGRQLIELMRAGNDIGITPDGPRGPLYVVEPGVLVVTRRNDAPMVLLGAEFGPARRLRSWDRFYIPWPFTRIKLRCTVLPAKNADGTKLSADQVRAALIAINPDKG